MPKSLLRQSSLDRTLAALSEPTRRRLLQRLARKSQRASDACRGLHISRPAVSRHLTVLRRAGLVAVETRGRERIYRLVSHPRGLIEAREYFDRLSGFWDVALDAFKSFAEKEGGSMNVTKVIHVKRTVDAAFHLFTDAIGSWWPLREGFSYGGERTHEIFLEGRVGGRFYERYVDGSEFEVGRVTTYEPPHLVTFSWRSPGWEGATEVEVRFTADADGTRVELVHRGFEVGPKAESARKNFAGGWETVLARYAAAAALHTTV